MCEWVNMRVEYVKNMEDRIEILEEMVDQLKKLLEMADPGFSIDCAEYQLGRGGE